MMRLLKPVLSLTAFFLLMFAAPSAFAQSQANTGTIEGVVTDASSQVVAKAEVTLTNMGTNLTRVLTTDEDGRFPILHV